MRKLVILLICLFLPNLAFSYDGEELWREIRILCNIESDDPVYSFTQRLNIFNAAVGIIDQMEVANKQIDSLGLASKKIEYDLTDLNSSLYVRDVVATKIIGEKGFGRKVSVGDINKYSKAAGDKPRFFYFWNSNVGFAPPPGGGLTTIIYWSGTHRWFTDEIATFYGIPYCNSALLFNAAALYQQRRNNTAGYQNLMGIAQSMASDIAQIEQMIKDTKDIIFLPEVYEE